MSRCFGGTYHLHLQSWKSAEQETCLATCSRWFLARLIFNSEDGGDTFLRNVGSYTYYTALIPEDGKFPDTVCLYRASWCSGNALYLYLGSAVFKSRSSHRLLWLRFFVVFLSPYRQISEEYLDQATTISFQIHSSSLFTSHRTIQLTAL
jgi:hypothetical protein